MKMKKTITLLKFIDFIETYNESIREFNRPISVFNKKLAD